MEIIFVAWMLCVFVLPAPLAWFFYFKKGRKPWVLALAVVFTLFSGAALYMGMTPDRVFNNLH
jgi:hypothetical protein